jgi:hypothetical protein
MTGGSTSTGGSIMIGSAGATTGSLGIVTDRAPIAYRAVIAHRFAERPCITLTMICLKLFRSRVRRRM